MNNQSVRKNYLYNLISQVVSLIVPLVTTPYVSRVIGADGNGIYSYATSIVTYFVLFGNFGLSTYGQLSLSANRSDKQTKSNIFWGVFFSRAILLSVCIVAYLIGVMLSSTQYRLLYLLMTTQIFASLMDISWYFQGVENFKRVAIRNTIVKLIGVFLVFLLVKSKKDLWVYALILQGSVVIGNLSMFSGLSREIEKPMFHKLDVGFHIKSSIKYFIPTIATSVYMVLDKSMIGWITSSEAANGFYEQSTKIIQMSVSVLTSLSTVMLPRMALLFKQRKIDEVLMRLADSIEFILWLSSAIAFGIVAISRWVVPWYLGEGYEPCVLLLRIQAILVVIIGLNNCLGQQVLMPSGRQGNYNKGVILGSIINFLMNSLLIRWIGVYGAAISSVFAEAIILSIFMLYSKDYISVKTIMSLAKKKIFAGVFMAISLVLLSENVSFFRLIPTQVITGAFLYIVVLILMKDEYTITIIKQIVKKIRRKNKK